MTGQRTDVSVICATITDVIVRVQNEYKLQSTVTQPHNKVV